MNAWFVEPPDLASLTEDLSDDALIVFIDWLLGIASEPDLINTSLANYESNPWWWQTLIPGSSIRVRFVADTELQIIRLIEVRDLKPS